MDAAVDASVKFSEAQANNGCQTLVSTIDTRKVDEYLTLTPIKL